MSTLIIILQTQLIERSIGNSFSLKRAFDKLYFQKMIKNNFEVHFENFISVLLQ